MQAKYIKYIIKYLIMPVTVITVAKIIYELWIKGLI